MKNKPIRRTNGPLVIAIAVVAMMLSWVTLGSAQVGGPPGSPVDSTRNELTDAVATPEETAAAQAGMEKWISDTIGVSDVSQHIKTRELVKDKNNGEFHGRVDQYSRGIKVRGGHLNATINNGVVDDTRSHGGYLDDADSVDINPRLSEGSAIRIARRLLKQQIDQQGGPAERSRTRRDKNLLVDENVPADRAQLEIHPGGGKGQRKLTYHVSVRGDSRQGPIQLEAWVDQEGNIVEAYNNAQPGVFEGRGNTFYQGSQGLGAGIDYFNVDYWPGPSVWVLNDNYLRIGTYDMYGTTSSTYQAAISSCCGPYFGWNDRRSQLNERRRASLDRSDLQLHVLGIGPEVHR